MIVVVPTLSNSNTMFYPTSAITYRVLASLVFMGSKKYPYKGIIDRLATRGFSNGTNAWTADDHTCYTVDTAGGQGFLQILPIYVDHIIFPTLTKSAYTTEVCIYSQQLKNILDTRIGSSYRS